MSSPFNQKRLESLVHFAQRHKWRMERTRGGHIKLTKPGMPPIFTSFTPSDSRSQRNVIARMRRVQRQGKEKQYPERTL